MIGVITAVVLAAPQPGDYDPSTGKGSEWGKAAPIGLLVILLLGVAMVFLLRSFTRQLKKVPASFDPTERAGTGRDGAGASPVADPARVPASPDDGAAPDGRPRAGADEPPG